MGIIYFVILLIALECAYEENSSAACFLNDINERAVGMEIALTFNEICSFHACNSYSSCFRTFLIYLYGCLLLHLTYKDLLLVFANQ